MSFLSALMLAIAIGIAGICIASSIESGLEGLADAVRGDEGGRGDG